MAKEIVASGSWLSGGSAESPVWIVRADFDFWYEVAAADGDLEPGEKPELNDEGASYYVVFGPPRDGKFWPDGGGHRSVEEAQQAAEAKVPTAIRWKAR